MDRNTMMKFKALFESQRDSLAYSAAYARENFEIQKDDTADEMDLTSVEVEQSMRMRLKSREVLFTKKIDEALAKIQAGTFGDCEDCEGEIELRRLEARPTANLCVSCKEEQERNEKGHADGQRFKSLGRGLSLATA